MKEHQGSYILCKGQLGQQLPNAAICCVRFPESLSLQPQPESLNFDYAPQATPLARFHLIAHGTCDAVIVLFRMIFATERERNRVLKYYLALLMPGSWIQYINKDRDILPSPSARREWTDETGQRVYRTMQNQNVL